MQLSATHLAALFTLSLSLLGLGGLSAYSGFFLKNPVQSASATVALKATVESLLEQADLVMHAEILKTWSPQTRGERGQIYTYTRLKPLDLWRGKLETPEVILVQLGGQIGDLRLEVHGDAKFKEGEEVILFLKRSTSPLPIPIESTALQEDDLKLNAAPLAVHLVSMAQSVFYVDRSSNAEAALLRQDLDGVVFYEPAVSPIKLKHARVAHEAKPALTLGALKAKLHSLMSKPELPTSQSPQHDRADGATP